MNYSTNLQPKQLGYLNDVLDFAVNNPFADFYHRKYQDLNLNLPLKSYEELCLLPILVKDEIIDLTLAERTFIDPSQVVCYNISSGTTNRNRPTIVPQASIDLKQNPEYNFDHKLFEKLQISKILVLQKPLSPGFFKDLIRPKRFGMSIPGDIYNLKQTALIAQEIAIEGIITSPTLLDMFLIELLKINFDLNRIKFVSLGSEFCSTQKANYFKTKLPNALLRFRYYCSEATMVGYRCAELDHRPPHLFYPAPAALLEIVDDQYQPLPLGEAGQILFTSLDKAAMPLLRYNLNDLGVLQSCNCSCGQKYILDLGGRKNFDAIRFYGVNLMSQMIKNSLVGISQYFAERLEMHIYEELIADKLKPKLEMRLQLLPEHQGLISDYYFQDMIINKISTQLQVSAKSNLADLVKDNIFLPLNLVFIKNWPDDDRKQQIIVSHLD